MKPEIKLFNFLKYLYTKHFVVQIIALVDTRSLITIYKSGIVQQFLHKYL